MLIYLTISWSRTKGEWEMPQPKVGISEHKRNWVKYNEKLVRRGEFYLDLIDNALKEYAKKLNLKKR